MIARARVLVVLATAWCVAACGGSPPGGAAEPDPDDLGALLRDLEVRESEIDAQLGTDKSESRMDPDGMAHDAPPARGGLEADEEMSRQSEASEPEPEPTGSGAGSSVRAHQPSPCAVACRALASMERSADRICELTGQDDSRCVTATDRVSRARDRVRAAGCGCAAP